jgi:hypothetical protein
MLPSSRRDPVTLATSEGHAGCGTRAPGGLLPVPV